MNDDHSAKKKYRVIWAGASIFFLFCGILWFGYWITWGQYRQTTEDAYVNGNLILIKPFEAGIVVSVLADNAQMVEKGQPLIELDRHDFEIALEKAKGNLGDAIRQTVQTFLKVEELAAKIEMAKNQLVRAQLDFEHRSALVSDGSVSQEDFEHSEIEWAVAQAFLTETEKEYEGVRSQVENTTPFTHPTVEIAKAELKRAFLALHRTVVLAPVRGLIAQRKAQVGQWAATGDPLMSLIPLDQVWVDANFREMELKNLRVGQPVELRSEMYGSAVRFHGRVTGLNPGTGSVFSILPPQNATGNWIKIIQRVPVRIDLHSAELQSHPLVLGLTMTTTVDTHDRTGYKIPQAEPVKPIYDTNIYLDELKEVDGMIEKIFAENCSPSDAARSFVKVEEF